MHAGSAPMAQHPSQLCLSAAPESLEREALPPRRPTPLPPAPPPGPASTLITPNQK